MTRIFIAPLLVLVVVLSAAALPRSAARSPLRLPATPYRYANVVLPAHFTQAGRKDDNTPPDNPLSDDGATLGRVLFYDKRLSANNTTSCASCHVQAHAFADPKPFSRGFHGAVTDRRAMPLVNVRYYLAGLLVVLAAAPATAQSRIAILDATGISVLDTTTGQLRARFELPLSPEEHLRNITASADGARLLVTSQAGAGGVLYVLDAVTGDVIARVPGRPSNGNPVVLPDGARAHSRCRRGTSGGGGFSARADRRRPGLARPRWGLDRGAAAGSGVDAFHVWAYPVAGGAPQFVGVAAPTLRPDVAGIFEPQFVGAGFLLTGATLPAGTYDLAVFAHSSVTQSFNNWRVVRINVQ